MTERLLVSPASLARAAERIRQGGLVAFPTETVYGLGARADDAAAVRSIFAAKGRPPGNPLIVHVPRTASARALAARWPDAAETLATAFWPGPLTLVVERRLDGVVAGATAGGPTVALRIPAHPVALALLEAADLPIAAPSANRSTTISPTTADHVQKSLDGRIDVILDGGPTGFGIESSIVDVSQTPAVLLRQGALSLATLSALVPLVDRSTGVVPEGERAAAPGGHARHYAPRARLLLLAPDAVRGAVEALRAGGAPVGSLERAPGTVSGGPREILPSDPAGYAAGLYAALHRLEDAGCTAIVAGLPPDGDPWAAVHDRLRRAAVPEG